VEKVYNLFSDLIEFVVCGYQFRRVDNYDLVKEKGYRRSGFRIHERFEENDFTELREDIPERIGEHVNTFIVKKDHVIEQESIFYSDGKRLDDIILLLRFFLGHYVCLEYETKEVWNKYTGEEIESSRRLRYVIAAVSNILTKFDRNSIKENKIDKLIFFFIELQKMKYLDLQIALISPIINILVDLNARDNKDDNGQLINELTALSEKIKLDKDYSERETEILLISLSKYRNSISSDFTQKTIDFLKSVDIILLFVNQNGFDDKIKSLAQRMNTLRNGVLHSGDLRSSQIERRFKNDLLENDDSTFTPKIRVYQIMQILVVNSILKLLGIEDYFYKRQDINTIGEYFTIGTFRGL
jgi:hypothetical protein